MVVGTASACRVLSSSSQLVLLHDCVRLPLSAGDALSIRAVSEWLIHITQVCVSVLSECTCVFVRVNMLVTLDKGSAAAAVDLHRAQIHLRGGSVDPELLYHIVL